MKGEKMSFIYKVQNGKQVDLCIKVIDEKGRVREKVVASNVDLAYIDILESSYDIRNVALCLLNMVRHPLLDENPCWQENIEKAENFLNNFVGIQVKTKIF